MIIISEIYNYYKFCFQKFEFYSLYKDKKLRGFLEILYYFYTKCIDFKYFHLYFIVNLILFFFLEPKVSNFLLEKEKIAYKPNYIAAFKKFK